MIKRLILAATFSLISSCASTPDQAAPERAAAVKAISSVPGEGLPPQRLAPGKCGLFLWGMSAPRKFVFFAEGSANEALALIDEKPASVPMTAAGGDVFGQFLTRMIFEDRASGTRVTVAIEPGDVLEGGQRVDSGNLTFRDAAGWETILPVTGVRACMP